MHSPSWFNVLDFGAAGDGVHDDGPAFSAAFAAALSAPDGGTVYAPDAKYNIATPVIASGAFGFAPTIVLEGDGSKSVISPNTPGAPYTFHFTNINLRCEKLLFSGTGGAASLSAVIAFSSASIGQFENVRFSSMTAPDAILLNVDGTLLLKRVDFDLSVQTSLTSGSAWISCVSAGPGFKGLRAIDCNFGNGDQVTYITGSVFYFGDPNYPVDKLVNQLPVEIGHCRMMGGCSQEIVKFDPSALVRYNAIWIHDCNMDTQEGSTKAIIAIKQANYISIERCWNGFGGGETPPRAAYSFVDAGDVYVENCYLDGDDVVRPPLQGAIEISADALTKSLTVTDTFYTDIITSCPTFVVSHGVKSRWRKGTLVPASVYTKIDPTHPGQVLTLATDDSPEKRVGVSLDATSPATGFALFDATHNITEGDSFPLYDGVNSTPATPTHVYFTLAAVVYPGITVQVTNAMTSDQRATAFANAVNAAHGPTFKITAVTAGGGTGRVDLTNDTEGEVGNFPTPWAYTFAVPGNVSIVLGAILVFAMGGGISSVRNVEQLGQEVPIKSDGATVITAGDVIEASDTVAGHARKSNDGNTGVATGNAPNALDAIFNIITR